MRRWCGWKGSCVICGGATDGGGFLDAGDGGVKADGALGVVSDANIALCGRGCVGGALDGGMDGAVGGSGACITNGGCRMDDDGADGGRANRGGADGGRANSGGADGGRANSGGANGGDANFDF